LNEISTFSDAEVEKFDSVICSLDEGDKEVSSWYIVRDFTNIVTSRDELGLGLARRSTLA
jgi:hypothetical protein